MRAAVSVLALAFLLPAVPTAGWHAETGTPRTAIDETGMPRTAIFFYPWFGTPVRDGAYQHWAQNHHVLLADIASGFYPARAAYSSSNPAVVQAQMREIASAGCKKWCPRGGAGTRPRTSDC